ncbi:uncharacterized protein N7484_008226 [Penicillium longicatenatum]|uniref:uncharacterized protein n=1 Tax=Penicillium longicatenatum TaxID=1561947 RepID=UPI0025469D75|nr:uncharacterized protein N7484_008226 [Penicillium longicatenatum]KAJ5640364.1 hypothetical protein N7484_008226 [Penicillium longicatenatum]
MPDYQQFGLVQSEVQSEDQTPSCVSSDASSIFSDNESESESNSDLETESDDSDDEDSPDDFDTDKGQLPPEHYLAEAEGLDVSRLRQKRYSDKTEEQLNDTSAYWNRYCEHIKVDPVKKWHWISDSEETVRFLYGFFSWRCDIRRGKNGRHCPGLRYKSSLETFWKNWHLVLKQHTKSGLGKETIVKVQDIIALVAKDKKLGLTRRPKKNMFIEDVSEVARVLLTTTETTFLCGWQRVQVLLFLQLAAITASRPGALLDLRWRDIALTLIRDPEGGRPRLFIFLTPECTKKFLGKKAPNEFKIPEIIFDPTLVLSPHVCLLSMLFHIKGFKTMSSTGPVLDCPENLYRLRVLEGLGQQQLRLKDEILNGFVFCQVVKDVTGYRVTLEKRMTSSMVRSRLRRVGQITGIESDIKPYNLRYAGAKALNKSEEVTDALQNVILQHSDIRTFVRHYEVDVDVDVQGIIRGTGTQSQLVRFACSLSATIDPDRPYKLSTMESLSINDLPVIRELEKKASMRKKKLQDVQAKLKCIDRVREPNEERLLIDQRQLEEKQVVYHTRAKEALRRLHRANREVRNEKQRQRNKRIRENLERYRNEQPVLDLEQQLQGSCVDSKVKGALENTGFTSPEFMKVIDTVLTMPGATIEAEYQRRINAINALTTFCGVEEGRPTPRTTQSCRRPAADDIPSCPAKRHKISTDEDHEIILRQAMESVRIKAQDERPTICFLCVGNPKLPLEKRVLKHTTPGSLTRHFRITHVDRAWPTDGVACNVCGIESLQQKFTLLNHAEEAHGTVVRGRAQERLRKEFMSI